MHIHVCINYITPVIVPYLCLYIFTSEKKLVYVYLSSISLSRVPHYFYVSIIVVTVLILLSQLYFTSQSA